MAPGAGKPRPLAMDIELWDAKETTTSAMAM